MGEYRDEHIDEPWFDDVHIISREWVEIGVTTTRGRKVWYRIPRQTLFKVADEVRDSPDPVGLP
jgi:hypothetical protein